MPELSFRTVGLYRRTVSAVPLLKCLVPVRSLEDQPVPFGIELGDLCPDVAFYLLEDESGRRHWGKRWLGDRVALLETTRKVESYLATLGRHDLCLAKGCSPEFGLIYDFEATLFSASAVVHQADCALFFDDGERKRIDLFARSRVAWPGLPAVSIGTLTDFQVVRTPAGLVFLDFEPSRTYADLLAQVKIC